MTEKEQIFAKIERHDIVKSLFISITLKFVNFAIIVLKHKLQINGKSFVY